MKHSQAVSEWFDKILALSPGDELWIPCNDLSHQNSLKTQFYSKRREFSIAEPVKGEKVSFSKRIKLDLNTNTKYWLVGYQKSIDPTVAYVKKKNKEVEEVTISLKAIDPMKEQNFHRMVTDGLPLEEVKTIYDMTEDEVALYESLIEDRELILKKS